jgi:membrane dipeptidase
MLTDLHCDSLLAHTSGKRDLRQRSAGGHLDIPRLKQGGVGAQVFAVWVDPELPASDYVPFVERNLAALGALCIEPADDIRLVRTADELRAVTQSGRIAAIAAVEGGHALGGDLAGLDRFHRLGVRILTVTWCNSNELADGGWDKNQPHNGLSDTGREAIRRMNALGMIVDVSHCSRKAFFDILDTTAAPVIASHSGADAVCRHFSNRNLADEQLKRLAENRGVIGAVFVPAFLAPDEGKDASIEDVVRHIDHIVQLTGPDHVGIGSDFDGFDGNLAGLEDCTKLPDLLERLRRRGYSEADIAKIAGLNFLRVWDQVIACAASYGPPAPGPLPKISDLQSGI